VASSFARDSRLTLQQNIGVYYLIRYALNRLEPQDEKNRKLAAKQAMQRLDRRDQARGQGDHRIRKEDLVLNQYEQIIASEVIAPEDIPVNFNGLYFPC
jgi:hypothetical protein